MSSTAEQQTLPPQHQDRQPGRQGPLDPPPQSDRPERAGSNRLKDRVVLITGGDSGIGRAIAVGAAKEGDRRAWHPRQRGRPMIAATFTAEQVAKFGQDTPMKRPGQPVEVADAAIFLASDDASYISGQTLHVNGGTVVNG